MRWVLRNIFLFTIIVAGYQLSFCQPFTHADTLRGSNGPGRNWWKVLRYDLNVKFNINDSTISGYNQIRFNVSKKSGTMQIDLQEPLTIDRIIMSCTLPPGTIKLPNGSGEPSVLTQIITNYTRIGNAYFIPYINAYADVAPSVLTIYYHGKPRVAVKPPWDGGVVWTKDKIKRPWVSIACQGLGASAWYPCKDYQGDEPDSGASLTITVPDTLIAVGNGRLADTATDSIGTKSYRWEVKSPINNYCIIPYIGKYVHFGEIYKGEKGNLTMDYWVLDYNLEKAKKQFEDAPKMMKAFEYWFGPYPFYKDGYKLVDAPYLGMEHQSATAYGNGYKNGYYGKDLSGSGWGLKWDFIIVHESGHEWFGNNITSKDIADMWIHEGFTNYSEALFTEYYYGKEAADDYVIGLRQNVVNDVPVIAPYGVNKEGSEDMYYKASNMIHTIRQVINNDTLFRKILRGLNQTFYHQTVTTKQIEDYINTTSKIDFSKVFDQYLRTIQIPILEYKVKEDSIFYHWANCVPGFNLPLKINLKGAIKWINPTEDWQSMQGALGENDKFAVDRNFYINTKKVD